MGNTKTKRQIEWWYSKRELVIDSLVKTSDAYTARILSENLKYIDDKITELEQKRIRHRKVGK